MILGVFKYYNFFVDSFCSLFHLKSVLTMSVILPVGISFYTFQALSYSIDVYRGNIKPTKDIIAFFAYVSFFPQLVAGPIERATNLLPQFEHARIFNYEVAVDGCRRILWGLFKKIVIADNCAFYVDCVWNDYASQNASTLVLAAILFAFQIYGDFSGYSDIAIGSAKLFGINLKDNFRMPYFSRNVAEFWKRWHISLNTWFVDYVYIPLGGSRGTCLSPLTSRLSPTARTMCATIRNTFIIFLLSGLWHGANWTYVGWGLYHALLFVPLILLGQTKKYKGIATWSEIPQMVFVFVLVCIGWIIFRASSISEAGNFLFSMCNKSLLDIPMLMTRTFYIPLFIAITIMIVVEWISRNKMYELEVLAGKVCVVRWSIYILLVFAIMLFQSQQDVQFIYFQF